MENTNVVNEVVETTNAAEEAANNSKNGLRGLAIATGITLGGVLLFKLVKKGVKVAKDFVQKRKEKKLAAETEVIDVETETENTAE